MPEHTRVLDHRLGTRRAHRRHLQRARPARTRSSSRASRPRRPTSPAASSCSPPTSRTTPASPKPITGPELMAKMRAQAPALRRRPARRTRCTGSTPPATLSRVAHRRRRAEHHRRRGDPGHGRARRSCWTCPARSATSATASRRARRATASSFAARTSPSSAAATRPWRRRSSSRASRRASPSCTAATRFAPRRSCRSAPSPHEKIRFAWNTQVTEVLGDDKVTGLAVRDTVDRRRARARRHRRLRRDRPRAEHHARHTDQVELEENGYVRTGPGTLHEHRGPLRRGRRPGPRLPPGRDLGGVGLHRGDRRRAVARGAGSRNAPVAKSGSPRRTTAGVRGGSYERERSRP